MVLAAVGLGMAPAMAEAVATPVDLSSWTAEGYGGGFNWVLQPENTSVLQTVNGAPTVFYGPGNAQGRQLSGTIKVATTGDDDFVGFVLGFQPGDLAAASTDFILIDWKQSRQSLYGGTALRGLAIHRVTAGLADNQGAWFKAPGFGITTLARGNTLFDTGWADNTEYSFDLVFTSSNIQVFVNDVLEFDIDGTFADGAFGFYNYSQANVLYAGIEETILPPPPPPPPVGGVVPEPSTWAMLIAGFGLVGGLARRRRHGAAVSA
jgi:hypothetical protein